MHFKKSLTYIPKLTASIVFSHSTRASKNFREINTEPFFKLQNKTLKTQMNYKQRLNQNKQDLHFKSLPVGIWLFFFFSYFPFFFLLENQVCNYLTKNKIATVSGKNVFLEEWALKKEAFITRYIPWNSLPCTISYFTATRVLSCHSVFNKNRKCQASLPSKNNLLPFPPPKAESLNEMVKLILKKMKLLFKFLLN